EGDFNMAGGEAIVRQILHAKRYIADRFGVEPRICWQPDIYGHPTNMPQVLKKAGIDYYYFTRCSFGKRVFWWEGPDGSRLLAYSSNYNNCIKPENIASFSCEAADKFGLKHALFVYGVGDHGGGPTRDDIRRAHFMQKLPAIPRLQFGGVNDYFDAVAGSGADIPVFKGELNFTFPGSYTTHCNVKKWNRLSESRLIEAEAFSSLAAWDGLAYPAQELDEAWKNTLFNQFHDILCGSAIHESYDYSRGLAERALNLADTAASAARRRLAPKASDSASPGPAVAIFNPLAWERNDLTTVALPAEQACGVHSAVDEHGNAWPIQRHGDRIIFMARQVPALGYKTFFLSTREPSTSSKPPVVETKNMTLQNEFFRLRLCRQSGIIAELHDLQADRQVLGRFHSTHEHGAPIASNIFQLLEEMPVAMSAWMLSDVSRQENLHIAEEIAVTAEGPVMAEITVVYRWRQSLIRQAIRLYDGLRRIDMPITVEWGEIGSLQKDAPMLKLAFTPLLGRTTAAFESPFGWDERRADGREMPALRWIDLSDDEYGLSLLNDCKYGFDVCGNTMRMSIVRSSYFPDPEPDTGRQDLICALYPHPGGWREAETVRRGYELNNPLSSQILSRTAGRQENPTRGFLSVAPANVMVSALKKAEQGDNLILRLYEAAGRDAEAEIVFNLPSGVAAIREVDLLERPIGNAAPLRTDAGGRLFLTMKAWEIKTLLLERKTQGP
ncbi:MAG: glycoside hydrolase family 38 C-terminal domain-containing protein, partial [Kiritimatiellota bacterium]|nr:glycoside hydrolase family 38 C-terminal domain-containing protein [Kiritimatiellota bacterium]